MSTNIFPVPASSPFLNSNNKPNEPWLRYLKALGDDALDAQNLIGKKTEFKYVLDGIRVFFTINKPSIAEATYDLPYPALTNFLVMMNGSTNMIVTTTQNSFTIPSEVSVASGWYFALTGGK